MISVPASADGYQAVTCRDVLSSEWDSFLAICSEGHHEQTSLWGQLKACYGWRPVRILIRLGGRIVGGVQILEKRTRFGLLGYVTHGPVIENRSESVAARVFQAIAEVVRTDGIKYLAVILPYRGQWLSPYLAEAGFRAKPDLLPPSGVMTATLVIDLTADHDSLMRQMRTSTRSNIRRAERSGVRVREGAIADVDRFRDLMIALCTRRGAAPNPPQKGFFRDLWRIFAPADIAKLFVAEIDGEIVSAAMAFAFGDTVRVWKVGWSGTHPKCYPNEAMWWAAIRWAKDAGFRFFDFVQLDEDIAKSLASGGVVDWKFTETTRLTGVNVKTSSSFKLGFGGEVLVLPPPYYRFYCPLAPAFMRVAGERLIRSSLVAGAMNRLAAQSYGD